MTALMATKIVESIRASGLLYAAEYVMGQRQVSTDTWTVEIWKIENNKSAVTHREIAVFSTSVQWSAFATARHAYNVHLSQKVVR